MNLAPTLKRISVSPQKLILDPNNPRFLTRESDAYLEDDFLNTGVMNATFSKMSNDQNRIKALEQSIKKNGWQPIDSIFVKKHRNQGHYLVLEGNRRVTAIQNLLEKHKKKNKKDDVLNEKLFNDLDPIEVMEIIDDVSPEELKVKITYLLGVRHHGSLKSWSPFARAYNIYLHYLKLARQTEENFSLNLDICQQIAETLNLSSSQDVEKMLRIYCAIKQVGSIPAIKKVNGIKDKYYSLFEEVCLKNKNSKLSEYIKIDPSTFLLTDQSIERMDNLCHFSDPKGKREGAPIVNPSEWRKLDKILKDEDQERREQMVQEVEIDKRCPSDVWAERSEEIKKLRWETWLKHALDIVRRVNLGDDFESPDAQKAGKRLATLLTELDKKEKE